MAGRLPARRQMCIAAQNGLSCASSAVLPRGSRQNSARGPQFQISSVGRYLAKSGKWPDRYSAARYWAFARSAGLSRRFNADRRLCNSVSGDLIGAALRSDNLRLPSAMARSWRPMSETGRKTAQMEEYWAPDEPRWSFADPYELPRVARSRLNWTRVSRRP